MLYILFSAQRQAIHDKLTRTAVIHSVTKNQNTLAEKNDTGNYLDPAYHYPSAWIRFIMFVGWYILSLILSAIVLRIVVSAVTDESDTWPGWVEHWSNLINIILLVGLAMLGGEGRLPGAKRKLKVGAEK